MNSMVGSASTASSAQIGAAAPRSRLSARVKPAASSRGSSAMRENPANETRRAASDRLRTGQLETLKAIW
jgi:hypothetical protein